MWQTAPHTDLKADGTERVMTHTANLMVKACNDLSVGDEDDAPDSDDARGNLALAIKVKRM